MVESGDSGFLRIGDQAVDGLLSINVGFMLEVAAEGAACGLKNDTCHRKREEQHQKTLAAGERS